jgi:hypothetical protein
MLHDKLDLLVIHPTALVDVFGSSSPDSAGCEVVVRAGDVAGLSLKSVASGTALRSQWRVAGPGRRIVPAGARSSRGGTARATDPAPPGHHLRGAGITEIPSSPRNEPAVPFLTVTDVVIPPPNGAPRHPAQNPSRAIEHLASKSGLTRRGATNGRG